MKDIFQCFRVSPTLLRAKVTKEQGRPEASKLTGEQSMEDKADISISSWSGQTYTNRTWGEDQSIILTRFIHLNSRLFLHSLFIFSPLPSQPLRRGEMKGRTWSRLSWPKVSSPLRNYISSEKSKCHFVGRLIHSLMQEEEEWKVDQEARSKWREEEEESNCWIIKKNFYHVMIP